MTRSSRRSFLKKAGFVTSAVSISGGIAIAQHDTQQQKSQSQGWTMYRGGVGRTGATNNSGPTAQTTSEWSMDLNGGMHTTEPIVADGTLYLAVTTANSPSDNNGYIAAYDAESGNKKWQRSDFAQPSTPSLDKEGLYFATSTSPDNDKTGNFYALDPATGETKWSRQEYQSAPSPVVANGRVYTDGKGASALDTATGETAWKRDNVRGLASFANGTLFYSNGTALNAANGSVKWSVGTGSIRFHAVSGGRVYGVEKKENGISIQARSADDGTIIWSYEITDVQYTSYLTVTDNWVLFRTGAVESSKIIALDAKSGSIAWIHESSNTEFASDLSIADGTVYIGGRTDPESETGKAVVVGLDVTSGAQQSRHIIGGWDFDEYGPAANTPIVANNRIFTATYPLGSVTDYHYPEYGNFHVLGDTNAGPGETTTTTNRQKTTTQSSTTKETTTTTNRQTTTTQSSMTKGPTSTTDRQTTTLSSTTKQPTATKTTTRPSAPTSTTTNNSMKTTTMGTTTTTEAATSPSSGQPGFEFLTALGGIVSTIMYLATKKRSEDS